MKRKIKFPIFLKFVAIMVTLGTAPLIFVGIRTVDINSKALRETILDLHKEIVISLSDKIYFYLTEISNEIPYITRIITKPDIPWEARETILSTMVDSHPSIVYISLLDSEGREKTKVLNPSLEKYQKLLSFKNEPVFQKFISSKNDFETSDVYYPAQDTKKDSPRINLFYRISGTINILIVLNLKPLFDEIKSKRFRKSGEVFLIDKSGDVISGRAVKAGDEPSIEKSSMVERAIKSLTVGSATYRDNRGIEMVGAYAPVKGIKWFLIVQEPLREAYHSSFLMQRQAVLIIIISALLSAAIAFFFARRLTGPIIDLIRAAAKIARREFSVRVNSRTNDEMNDLILTFNEMGAELKKYDDMQVDKIIAEKTKTEAVIFSIADGIIMTDLAGKILLINKQAKDILNVATDAAEERPIWDFLADKRLQEAFKSLTGDFKDNQLRIKEIDLSSENTVQFFNAGTKPVITQKGEKIGLVTVIRDITLEKEIDRMKDDFVHSITHD
ncbi:MAG: cache domain-containing protein, partial [Elusimicrobiota bacterium]